MKTYREVVYMILDSLKEITDDSYWEEEHIVFQINKYRSLLFKQRYLDKKREIPNAFYQRLMISFESERVGNNTYKSIKTIPATIDNGLMHSYTYLSRDGITSMNFNLINPQRFKLVGWNKWLRSEVYATIDLDNHMYIKSYTGDVVNSALATINSDGYEHLVMSEDAQNVLIIDGIMESKLIYDTILDDPTEIISFNELDIQDQLDLDFPCDESLIQTIIELTVSEIAKLNGLPKDFMNNANDDVNLGVRGGKE